MRWYFYEGTNQDFSEEFPDASVLPEFVGPARESLARLKIPDLDIQQLLPHWNGDKVHPGILFRSKAGSKVILATLRPLADPKGLTLIAQE